jgi:hypothetical protein
MEQHPILTLADIQERRKALDKERADLDAAERVLRAHGQRLLDAEADSVEGLAAAAKRDMSRPPIKQLILLVINDSNGLPSQKILAAIQDEIPGYKAQNVSPKLSFFKQKGWLTLNEGLWKITESGKAEMIKSNNPRS